MAPVADQQLAAEAAAGVAQKQDSTGAAADASSGAKKKVKRNVAMHVGYVGTDYTGLQANRQLPELATVEGVLEKAILQAGLITEANFGDFRKTKWSRSSRTDKGVHSLATVIGLRILMDEEDYLTDCEGIAYARAINQHLPEDVCVFAVQRTNKSFDARRWCGSRTYEYYLPASVLGLDTPDGSSPEDQARLALLRNVLQAYCGYKPYQNYAGNRSQYVGQKAKAQRRKERREAREASEASSDALSSSEADDASAAAAAAAEPVAAASTAADADTSSSSTAVKAAKNRGKKKGDDSEGGEESEADTKADAALYAAAAADYSGEGPVPPELQWRQQVRFLSAPDPDDPVVKSHYRMIRHFTADDPKPLVPGGVPCLRLEVCADSFMLHQIRHMVGAAVAIVRGIIPRELLELSLSAPGRVTLPRAPPHSLLLFSNQFSPFPAGWGLETPLVAKYTGDRLQLREGGQQMRQQFREQMFNAAINDLLKHPDWELWSRRVLPRYLYADEDVQPAVAQHREWYTELMAKRAQAAEKAAAKAAAAAEAEAAAEAAAAAASQEQPLQKQGSWLEDGLRALAGMLGGSKS